MLTNQAEKKHAQELAELKQALQDLTKKLSKIEHQQRRQGSTQARSEKGESGGDRGERGRERGMSRQRSRERERESATTRDRFSRMPPSPLFLFFLNLNVLHLCFIGIGSVTEIVTEHTGQVIARVIALINLITFIP